MNRYKCRFCDNGKNIITYKENGKIINKTFLDTENFYLIVSVGAVVKGHILIISKKHYLSMVEMTESEIGELICIISFMRKVLKQLFDGEVIGFEHGTGKNAIISSASVTHAHFHLLPIRESLLNDLKNDGFEIEPLLSINDLSLVKSSYLVYQDINGKYYKVNGQKLPSQYFRQKVCEKYNDEKWDWKKFDKKENIIDTMNTLESFDINTLYNDFYYEYYLKKEIMNIIKIENIDDLRLTSKIQQELGLDSIKMIELIVSLENKFNLTFDDNMLDLNNFQTINDILKVLKKEIEHENRK